MGQDSVTAPFSIVQPPPKHGQVVCLLLRTPTCSQVGGSDGAGATGATLVHEHNTEAGSGLLQPADCLSGARRLKARAT